MTNATALWVPGVGWKSALNGAIVGAPPTNTFTVTAEVGGNDVRSPGSGIHQGIAYDWCRAALGRDLGGRIKFFSNGNIADAVTQKTVGTAHSTEPLPIYCIKSWTAAQINAFLDTLNYHCILIWWQEFYANTQPEWDDYNAQFAGIKAVRDAHANGHFMKLQACSSSNDERTMTRGLYSRADAANFDYWGADSYNAISPPHSATKLFGPQKTAFDIMKAVNPSLQWWVSEYGISRYDVPQTVLWTGAQRIAYLQGHIDYLIDNGCSGITIWLTNNATSTALIKDWSTDQGTAADIEFAAYVVHLLDTYPLVVPT